jgi:ABC-type glycerol-3-phosphate transport system substrate-binding protein
MPDTTGASPLTRRELLGRGAAVGAAGIAASSFGAAPALAAARRKKKTTLTVLNWQTGAGSGEAEGIGLLAAGKKFDRLHPNIDVHYVSSPFTTYSATLLTKIRSRTLEDVVFLLPGGNNSAAWPALIKFKRSDIPYYNKLLFWRDVESSPRTYFGIPLAGQGIVFYYNKALFKKAGLNPNAPPQTWAQLSSAATKLKAAGIAPMGNTGSNGYNTWWMWMAFGMQYLTTVKELADLKAGKIKINDPRLAKPLGWVQKTYTNGWWQSDFASKTLDDTQSDFAAGRFAMICSLVSDYGNWAIWDQLMGTSAYGAFSAPLLPDAISKTPRTFYGDSLVICVNKSTKNRAEAMQYAAFMVSAVGQSIMLDKGNAFPNRFDVNVAGITRSKGAGTVEAALKKWPIGDANTRQFSTSVTTAALGGVQNAVVNNSVDSYLDDLTKLQAQG